MRTALLFLALHQAGAAGVGAGAPEWVHLVPAGVFSGVDGRGPYNVADPARVIEQTMTAAGGRLPIDENHSTDRALKQGGEAPARGWIVALEAREDGIWGRVEWTPAGRALLEEHAYRGISPVFAHAKDGEVLRLLRAGLTNAPNLQLATLHHQQGSHMDLAKLRKALGLADDADEAAILAAAETAGSAVTTHGQQLARIAEAAGVADPAKAGADAIVTALQTQRAGAGDDKKLREEVVALQTQLTTLRQDQSRAAAEKAVDAAILAGKPIPKALRDHYVARHMQDAKAVETELAALPSLHTGGLAGRGLAAEPDKAGLTPQEREVVAMMGLDPEAFAKTKAKQAEMTGVA